MPKFYRSARTGKFVTVEYVKKHPSTTVVETRSRKTVEQAKLSKIEMKIASLVVKTLRLTKNCLDTT